jgi:hypothetical protein
MKIKELPRDIQKLAYQEAELQKTQVTEESDIDESATFIWDKSRYGVRFWELCYIGDFEVARIKIGIKYSKTKEIIDAIKDIFNN